ncbi:creatininase family protein [Candidatus Bathyarchaeota archaeon]|nr:creatininase family protein [Candidatus Bathyarchaeota archaeon]
MHENRLAYLSGYSFKTLRFDKAVLPVGSTEYHGDHLPYGTDALVAEKLAEEAAGRVEGVLVLPTLPFGMSLHYASFPISLTLTTGTLISVLKEIFSSLLRHGILKLLVINGHDGNIAAIEAASREFRVEHPELKIAVLEAWWETAARSLPEGTFEAMGGLGHGGEGETSMMLALAPELVDMSRARGMEPRLPEGVQVKWLFHEITPYGVTGDPGKATREKGVMMRDALLDLLVSFLKRMDEDDWSLRRASEG